MREGGKLQRRSGVRPRHSQWLLLTSRGGRAAAPRIPSWSPTGTRAPLPAPRVRKGPGDGRGRCRRRRPGGGCQALRTGSPDAAGARCKALLRSVCFPRQRLCVRSCTERAGGALGCVWGTLIYLPATTEDELI